MKGKNPALVGLGSHIVNTGGCNDCHTNPSCAPGGDPFQGQPEQINTAGFLAGGRHFGPFVSANSRPTRSAGPRDSRSMSSRRCCAPATIPMRRPVNCCR